MVATFWKDGVVWSQGLLIRHGAFPFTAFFSSSSLFFYAPLLSLLLHLESGCLTFFATYFVHLATFTWFIIFLRSCLPNVSAVANTCRRWQFCYGRCDLWTGEVSLYSLYLLAALAAPFCGRRLATWKEKHQLSDTYRLPPF
jgi:hypothetical protein